MKAMTTQMFERLLKRQATDEEYRRMSEFLRALPEEFSNSPAQVASIVIMTENLSQFEAIVKRASWDAQQKIHADLPKRVDAAALHALHHIRDQMPIDASDSMSRMLKWGSIFFATIAFGFFALGFRAADALQDRANATQNVMAEQGFVTCMNAAAGAAAIVNKKSATTAGYDAAIHQARARLCAAEYAYRRAGGA